MEYRERMAQGDEKMEMKLITDEDGLLGVRELGCGWFELPSIKPFFFCLDQALECISSLESVPMETRLAVCRQLELVGLKPSIAEVVGALDLVQVARPDEMAGMRLEVGWWDRAKLLPYGLIVGNHRLTRVELWSLEMALGVLHHSAQSDMIGLNFMQARRLFSALRSANIPLDHKKWDQRFAKLDRAEQARVRQIRGG